MHDINPVGSVREITQPFVFLGKECLKKIDKTKNHQPNIKNLKQVGQEMVPNNFQLVSTPAGLERGIT